MKQVQLHIKITFAIFAVLAGAQVNAANMHVWLSVVEQHKECRLDQEKREVIAEVDEEEKAFKKTPFEKAPSFNFINNGVLLAQNHFTWGQNSLTKKAARGEFSLLEEDLNQLMLIKRSQYGEKSHSLR